MSENTQREADIDLRCKTAKIQGALLVGMVIAQGRTLESEGEALIDEHAELAVNIQADTMGNRAVMTLALSRQAIRNTFEHCARVLGIGGAE